MSEPEEGITLDRAIKIKAAYLRGDKPDDPLDLIKADWLSLEALKRVQLEHAERGASYIRRLPGETKD